MMLLLLLLTNHHFKIDDFKHATLNTQYNTNCASQLCLSSSFSPVVHGKTFTHKYKFPLKLATTIILQFSKCIRMKMKCDSVYMQFLININYTRIDRCVFPRWQLQCNESHIIAFDEVVAYKFIISKWNVCIRCVSIKFSLHFYMH